MAISKENKLIQIKVTKEMYELLKKVSTLLGVSISKMGEVAIQSYIIKNYTNIEELEKNGKYKL